MTMTFDRSPTIPDRYSRIAVSMFDDRKLARLPTGFQTFFSRGTGEDLFTDDPNIVEIEIIRGYEKLATMVKRGLYSRPTGDVTKPTKDVAGTTFDRMFPLIYEIADIDPGQLTVRAPDEMVYKSTTEADLRSQRLRYYAMGYHREHQMRAIRTMEYLASQSILTGEMPAIIGTSDAALKYDFRRSSSNAITAAALWTTATTDPFVDLDTMYDAISDNGKGDMNMVVTGRTVTQAFMNNPILKANADNRRFSVARVGKETDIPEELVPFISAKMRPYAHVWTPTGRDMWMCNYDGSYENEAGGTHTKLMPATSCFGVDTKARFDRYFGPDDTMPMNSERERFYSNVLGIKNSQRRTLPDAVDGRNVIKPEWFHYDAYGSFDWTTYHIRTQVAPIFAPTQTDAICTLTGTVA